MASKYIRYIDLGEVCAAMPTFHANGGVRAEHLQSVPQKMAGSVVESFHRFTNHPDLRIFGRAPKKITPKELAGLIDEALASVWEAIPGMSRRPSNRNPKGLPCLPDRFVYREISGRTCTDRPALDALLIYQLDRLCGAWQAGQVDEVLALIPDMLAIQRDIGDREGRSFSGEMLEIAGSHEARQRAALRHKPTNQQKTAALAAWDAHGANVSSMAAFARARHKEFGVTERTLGTWIREHRKTKQ